ncbi:hypothetical protein CsSME_00035824 [Camellia sinensis var. sinensis]
MSGSMTSVTGLNNNEYQIARGQVLNRNTRLDKTCNFVKVSRSGFWILDSGS